MGNSRFESNGSNRIIRLILFFFVGALLAVGLHYAIGAGLRRLKTSNFGAYNQVMLGQINAGIVINGSSRAVVHYDPTVIQRATGSTVFNIGRNASHSGLQAAILKAYLKRNAKPKLIIQNVDLHSFLPAEGIPDATEYIPYLSDDDLFAAVEKIQPDAWKWKTIPLYGYVVDDLRMTWISGLKAWSGWQPKEDHVLGFNPRYKSWTGDFNKFAASNPNGVYARTEPRGVDDFEDILRVASEAHIDVLLVYSPEYIEMQKLTVNRDQIFSRFLDYDRRPGVRFWDFSPSPICNDQSLFYNSQHLNAKGAALFSAQLAQYLAAVSAKPVDEYPPLSFSKGAGK